MCGCKASRLGPEKRNEGNVTPSAGVISSLFYGFTGSLFYGFTMFQVARIHCIQRVIVC